MAAKKASSTDRKSEPSGSEKRSYRIAVIAGDGIGAEVVREGRKCLEALSEQFGFRYEVAEYPYGADHYLSTREILPAGFLEEMRSRDAILLGAIGDPRVETGLLERGIVGALRFGLDLYVNLRPIKLYAAHLCPIKNKKREDLDILVVRENTEDVYAGTASFLKKGTPDEVAVQQMIYTRKGVERIIRYAMEAARARNGKKRITLCDKANAIAAHDLWRRTFEEIGAQYPDLEKDTAFVDAMAMWLVKNPEHFDVVVTTNLFGDILTDLGAMLQGGLGIAAGGNIHPGKVSMFEPIHGSAPKYKGKALANPLATINAVGMMLDFLGEREAAKTVEETVAALLESGAIPSLGADSGLRTDEIGDLVVAELRRTSTGTTQTTGALPGKSRPTGKQLSKR